MNEWVEKIGLLLLLDNLVGDLASSSGVVQAV